MSQEMTKSERQEFVSYMRQYVRGMKARGEAHAAQLTLASEEELSRIYEANDAMWKEAIEEADRAIAAANEQVKKVFTDRGLTNENRMPTLKGQWYGRGETFSKERRAELRKVAEAQAKLMSKAAAAKAEEISSEYQDKLFDLTWDEARDAMRALPKVEELMPPLDPRELHAIARQEHNGRQRWGRGYWPELVAGENGSDEDDGI